MLYNIYYSEEYMPNDFPLYIQETKEFNTFKEATCYAFQRCFEKQLDNVHEIRPIGHQQ